MTIAAINDVPILNTGAIRWSLKEGVRPVEEIFHVSPAGQERLAEQAPGPVTLRIDVGGDGQAVEFKFLYILDFPAGPNPHIKAVRIADRRWIWPSQHVLRRFNMRRKIGYRRVLDPSLPIELQPITEQIQYRNFSLLNKEAGSTGIWRGVKDAFKDVLEEVLKKEQEAFGVKAAVTIKDFGQEIPIENLVIDDGGPDAINRMLAYFPMAAVAIGAGGEVIVYSKVSGEETSRVTAAGAEITSQGHVEVVEQRLLRPKWIDVYFTREVEVRLDYRSAGAGPTGGLTEVSIPHNQIPGGASGINNKFLTNVLPLPDYKLTIDRKLQTQGNWVDIDTTLLNAWGAPPKGRVITDRTIRLDFVPFADLFNRTRSFGRFDTDANWPPRIAALRQHYRRTFRIDKRLMDVILSLKSERVGNVNVATAQRSPAAAYGDWSIVTTAKYWFEGNLEKVSYVINHSSFPEGSFSIVSADEPAAGAEETPGTKAMPAVVSVVDADQGIIQLAYASNPYGIYSEVLPGNYINGPSGDIANAKRKNVAFNATSQATRSQAMTLNDDFRLAIVLTIIPGSPNSKEQLQKVRITPKDVQDLLPASLKFNVSDAVGPPMARRIGPGVETARTAWSDNQAANIFGLVGLGNRPNQEAVNNLVVNLASGAGRRTGASLNRIALAEAARIYGSFGDRVQGQASMNIQPMEPAGSLSEVIFELDRKGVGTIQLGFPERFDPLDFFALLDSSTRAMVMGLATHIGVRR